MRHSIWCWLSSGDWKPSFDGIAAIAAGVIGFIAVVGQTRSSERSVRSQLQAERENLQKQLEAERNERKLETEKHRKAIAISLMTEIHDFETCFLAGLSGKLKTVDPDKVTSAELPWLGSAPPNPFEIYRATAAELGELGPETAAAVVRVYKSALDLLAAYKDYQNNSERIIASAGQSVTAVRNELWERVRHCLTLLKGGASTVSREAKAAREKLNEILKGSTD